MSAADGALSGSAFIADLNPRERTAWRVAATLVAGLASGVVIAVIVGVITIFVAAYAMGLFAGGPDVIRRNMAGLIAGSGQSVTGSIIVMLLAAATNGALAATFVGFAALFAGRSALRYLTAAPRLRWRLLAWGLASSLLVIGPVFALLQYLDPHAAPPPLLSLSSSLGDRVGYAIASVVLLIIAAAAEEVVFRGWLLRQSAAVTRNPLVLMVVNGILFSAVHFDFAPDAFLQRAIMGAGFVYMTLKLGGIEFSTGAHAANNIIIVLMIQPLTLKATASGGMSADVLLQDAFLFASYVAMTELTLRSGVLRRWTGADTATYQPASAVASTFS